MMSHWNRFDRTRALSLDAARADAELIARFRSGDSAAFDEILAKYWDPIVRYAERMLADRDLAHDIGQEAFIRLWLKRHEWKRIGGVGAFLYRTAHNLAIDENRKRGTRRRGVVARTAREETSPPSTPARDLERTHLRNALDRAVNALPERRREVFILYYFHNRTYRQIAETMGVKPQVVANYMSAALAELRRTLRPLLPDLLD